MEAGLKVRIGSHRQDGLFYADVPHHMKVHEADASANVKSWENESVNKRIGSTYLISGIEGEKKAEGMWVSDMN